MSTTHPVTAGRPLPQVPLPRLVVRQTLFDMRLQLRNGEQVLLTVIIPLVVLVGLSMSHLVSITVPAGATRVAAVLPGVLALAVLSTAFTALAIATGFDRRSGALRFLGTTPVQRSGLIWAKFLSALGVVALQVAVLLPTAMALGWRPDRGLIGALGLMVLGTAAFSCVGLALAGVLRAEATLAVANGLFVLLMLGGGVVVPVDRFPAAMAAVVSWLPSAALADGLRNLLLFHTAPSGQQLLVLLLWAGAGALIARRTFRWD